MSEFASSNTGEVQARTASNQANVDRRNIKVNIDKWRTYSIPPTGLVIWGWRYPRRKDSS